MALPTDIRTMAVLAAISIGIPAVFLVTTKSASDFKKPDAIVTPVSQVSSSDQSYARYAVMAVSDSLSICSRIVGEAGQSPNVNNICPVYNNPTVIPRIMQTGEIPDDVGMWVYCLRTIDFEILTPSEKVDRIQSLCNPFLDNGTDSAVFAESKKAP